VQVDTVLMTLPLDYCYQTFVLGAYEYYRIQAKNQYETMLSELVRIGKNQVNIIALLGSTLGTYESGFAK
jgi:hypothetical protein